MIMGEVDYDSGSFDKGDYVSIGYLPQDGGHVHSKTLYAEAESLGDVLEVQGKIEQPMRCSKWTPKRRSTTN